MRAQRCQRAHEEQRKARLEKAVQQQAARFDGDCGGEPFFGGGTGRPEAFAQQGEDQRLKFAVSLCRKVPELMKVQHDDLFRCPFIRVKRLERVQDVASDRAPG